MVALEDVCISHVTITEQPVQWTQHLMANEDQFNGEATCDVETLKKEIKQVCCNAGLQAAASGLGVLVILIYYAACSGPRGCICAKGVSNSWWLLLTRSWIYYTRKHHCMLPVPFSRHWHLYRFGWHQSLNAILSVQINIMWRWDAVQQPTYWQQWLLISK